MGSQRILFILMLLILGIFAGCSSSGDSGPTLPSPGGPQGGDYDGDQDEPPIPTPYQEIRNLGICDMEWELDGDLVVSTVEAGIFLYTPYGVLKRTYPDIECVYGLTNNDTGRGMSFYGMGSCNPNGIDDDIYVSEGHFTTHFDDAWYAGDPNHPDNPPGSCDQTITMQWGCSSAAGSPPNGYSYHPDSGRTYIQVNSGGVWIGDGDCEFDWDEDLGPILAGCAWDPGDVVLSYDQHAPFDDPPWLHDKWYNGPSNPNESPDVGDPFYPPQQPEQVYGEPFDVAGDWVVYVPSSVKSCIDGVLDRLRVKLGYAPVGYLRMANTVRVFSANGTDPPG